MSEPLKKHLMRWAITTLSVWVATQCVSGLHADDTQSLVLGALTLGLLNTFIRPLLLFLSLPILLLTLGLFAFVINAGLLLFVGWLYHGFHVDSFSAAFWGGMVIGVVGTLLGLVTGVGSLRGSVKVSGNVGTSRDATPPAPPRVSPGGDGPVIDV